MSLNYESGKLIANVYNKRDQVQESIYYKDIDENQREVSNKLRINEKEGYIFPEIEKFEDAGEQTQKLYVTASSGAGKSTFIREYIFHWKKKYPNCPIFLFSSKLEDKQLDDIKNLVRIKTDEEILTNPYTIAEITAKKADGYLVIFDDIESFSKKIRDLIYKFAEEIWMNGRSYKIYSIVTSHTPTNYRESRIFLMEATMVIIMPKRATANLYNYLLEKKLMISKPNIELINKLNSNWVCIRRLYPTVIISDKYILAT